MAGSACCWQAVAAGCRVAYFTVGFDKKFYCGVFNLIYLRVALQTRECLHKVCAMRIKIKSVWLVLLNRIVDPFLDGCAAILMLLVTNNSVSGKQGVEILRVSGVVRLKETVDRGWQFWIHVYLLLGC